jgi:basic membrane protein A and related proteins
MKKISLISVLILMLFVTTQCAPVTATEAPASQPPEPTVAPVEPAVVPEVGTPKLNKDNLKIAMILPGPITDMAWNAGGKAGLDYLGTTFKAKTAYQDNVQPTDFVEVFRDFASQGFNIIIGHGDQLSDAATTVSKEFPDTFFVVESGAGTPGGNLIYTGTHEAQCNFIGGFIAGRMTKTNKIAAIGGFDFPGIIAQLEGFRQGAEYGNPDVKVAITYIGTFEDASKAKEAALAQIDAGADVLYHIVDNAGVGIFEAVKERDVYAVGFSRDQSSLAPENVLTSNTSDFGLEYAAAVNLILSGKPISNELYKFGYETNPSPCGHADTNLISKELHEEAVALEQKLATGEVKTELIYTR